MIAVGALVVAALVLLVVALAGLGRAAALVSRRRREQDR